MFHVCFPICKQKSILTPHIAILLNIFNILPVKFCKFISNVKPTPLLLRIDNFSNICFTKLSVLERINKYQFMATLINV